MANAVANALQSFGVEPRQLPLSPGYIWELVQAGQTQGRGVACALSRCHSGRAEGANPESRAKTQLLVAVDPGFRVRALRARPGMTAVREAQPLLH